MQKRKRVTTNKEIPRNNESFALLHLQMYTLFFGVSLLFEKLEILQDRTHLTICFTQKESYYRGHKIKNIRIVRIIVFCM